MLSQESYTAAVWHSGRIPVYSNGEVGDDMEPPGQLADPSGS